MSKNSPRVAAKQPRQACSRLWHALLPWSIALTGWWVYRHSFSGPFIFDDLHTIVTNPHIRHLWPLTDTIVAPPEGGLAGRPLISLSLALNFAFGGLRVWGYHAVNLAIHLAAGLALFGVIRRTLLTDRLRARYGESSAWLAWTAALIWVVHPLHTESVTYIIQRSESFMGLCYVLTLYCVVRGATARRPRRWYLAAVSCSALGMASKAVMATAPAVVLLYDRVFLAGTFRRAWSQRRSLYLGLAATWGLLAVLLVHASRIPHPTVGFGFTVISPIEYARSQPGVLVHYLRLALWPSTLCLDYYWPVARSLGEALLPTGIIAALLWLTGWAWRRRPAVGFLGVVFFGILAPTSSVIPILDLAFEHRMYLPLAPIVLLAVIGGWELLRRVPVPPAAHRCLAAGLVAVVAGAFGTLTLQRNEVYRSELSIWNDVVAKRPGNPRAHSNLAVILGRLGRLDEAVAHCAEALRIQSDYAMAINNMGTILARQGKRDDALRYYAKAIDLQAGFAQPHNNIGLELLKQGRIDEAAAHFADALRLQPDYVEAHDNLGVAFASQGKLDEAISHHLEAIRLRPDFTEARNNLGLALANQGRLDEAVAQYAAALRLQPGFAEAHNNLGLALIAQGKLDEAIAQYLEALRLQPDSAEAHNNLGIALAREGNLEEAARYFSRALELKEDYPDARHNLAFALTQRGGQDATSRHAPATNKDR